MKVLFCVLALVAVAAGAPGVPGGRVYGGSNAQRGQYPSAGSAHYCILGYCSHSCGFTIISPTWVLTAAHCITELPGIGSLRMTVGILNQNDVNIERQTVNVGSYHIHPDYAGGVNPHDIALIRLSSSLLFNSQVQAATLPRQDDEAEGDATLIGWGSVGGIILPQMPNTLQRVNVPIVPTPQCDQALTAILQGAAHPLDLLANVCSGPLNAPISACSGDSGGPLLQDTTIVGIVSWGITPCGRADAPTVYVKVSRYINWIEGIVDEPLLFAE